MPILRKRRVWSIRSELLKKSQEAAIAAVKVFNDPLIKFKSETFIVLMIIAWTYLLHAYYRSKGIEYRYSVSVGSRRRFERTHHGAYKFWTLEKCLNEERCPIDSDSANNLRFLIGLRHEIEHQMTQSLDSYLSGRYQACALNYNFYLKKLFGKKYGLDEFLAYCIQFLELSEEQIMGSSPEAEIPERLRVYIVSFDKNLTEEQYNNPRFSYRLLFSQKLVNRPGQADKVIEFIKPDSELAREMEKYIMIKKEVERPKFRAKEVATIVQNAGFKKFRVQPEHVRMWKQEDAKNPTKGYGVEISGYWFWYKRWIDRCLELCEAEGDKYK